MHVYELYNISYFPTSQTLKQKCIVYGNEIHFNINVEVSYRCGNITSLSCWLFYFSILVPPPHGMIYLNFTVILLMKLAKILQY